MKRLNVLFVMPQMGMGGSERLVHNLVSKLDRSRFNPSVAWLFGDEVLQEFRDLRVPLHFVPKNKRVDFSTMRALRAIVDTHDIDVVNAQHFMPTVYSYYACKVAARRSLIFTAHSRWEVEEVPLKWRVVGGYLLRHIDASVGVTTDVSLAIRGTFNTGSGQTVTIENGVDTDLLVSAGKNSRTLRGALGIAESEIVIGIVANLKKVKNHLFLLQAFAEVSKDLGNVKLLLVGHGFGGEPDNTENELRTFVDNHELSTKVLFLGYRTDIADLLRVMDVFCLTSHREGLPIGLIEAMAAGLPVIGTNVEGIRDVIAADQDGLLVDPGDIGALKKALVALIRGREAREKLGNAGRQKAVKRYSLRRCVQEYEQLFQTVRSVSVKT